MAFVNMKEMNHMTIFFVNLLLFLFVKLAIILHETYMLLHPLVSKHVMTKCSPVCEIIHNTLQEKRNRPSEAIVQALLSQSNALLLFLFVE